MVEDIRVRKLHARMPVFALERGGKGVLYVPGYGLPVDSSVVAALETFWRNGAGDVAALASDLANTTTAVLNEWDTKRQKTFRPECLTIALPRTCNLACEYCFAGPPSKDPTPPLDIRAVEAAAEFVARHCADGRKIFHVAIQGPGEATERWDELQRCVELTRATAGRHGLQWFGHIATNGQLPPGRAVWLATHFSSICLSCDGPPDVQDAVRPRRDGGASSTWVEQTAAAFSRGSATIEVRATVTPRTVPRMRDIVFYVNNTLRMRSLRIEPAFRAGGGGFDEGMARPFVHEFLAAQRLATHLGMALTTSSPRLTELHGAFCETARDCLRLTPDGTAINCFCGVRPSAADSDIVGRYDATNGTFRCDDAAVQRMIARATASPPRCRDCLNQYHCSRTCPEQCPGANDSPAGAFRCAFQRLLSTQWIWDAAYPAEADAARLPTTATADSRSRLDEQLARAPAAVDREAIANQSRLAASRYDLEHQAMPAPPWVENAYSVRDAACWDTLRAASADTFNSEHIPGARPISVYIHVPFCSRKCLFCDCHSLAPQRGREQLEARYVDALLADLNAWTAYTNVGKRPVTTVHFGGGTPNCLGAEQLPRILDACRKALAVNSATEWAIETTASLLTPLELARLRALRFTRLHVGVQTLAEPLRQELGRRTSAGELLRRLEAAMAEDFVVSADVIYGLPKQDAASLLDTVDALAGTGLHGLSLYRLTLSKRNRAPWRRYPGTRSTADMSPAREFLRDYVMLQCADQRLAERGYRKNHFVHYALPTDRNLYFRHALRGEDLLALGASASGTCGGTDYRNYEYPRYVESRHTRPALEGLTIATPAELAIRRAASMLMCANLEREEFRAIGCESLFDAWERCALIERDEGLDRYRLTGVGSWLVREMIAEVRAYAKRGT